MAIHGVFIQSVCFQGHAVNTLPKKRAEASQDWTYPIQCAIHTGKPAKLKTAASQITASCKDDTPEEMTIKFRYLVQRRHITTVVVWKQVAAQIQDREVRTAFERFLSHPPVLKGD